MTEQESSIFSSDDSLNSLIIHENEPMQTEEQNQNIEAEIQAVLMRVKDKKKQIFKIIHNARQKDKCFLKRELLNYNRREKSLEELSKRFLSLFLDKDESLLSLDKITNQLGVERRRIYDIINILESLRLVSRKGKNNYKWNGFKKIYDTIKEYKENGEAPNHDLPEILDQQGQNFLSHKREKSLEMLSIGFLKLFLHWKQVMTLEEAARRLSSIQIDDHKIKTKIRRLYDIANVFKSLGLIKKTTLTETKKPAFHWIGITGLDSFAAKIQLEKDTDQEATKSSSQETELNKQTSQCISQISNNSATTASCNLSNSANLQAALTNPLNTSAFQLDQNLINSLVLKYFFGINNIMEKNTLQQPSSQQAVHQCHQSHQNSNCNANQLPIQKNCLIVNQNSSSMEQEQSQCQNTQNAFATAAASFMPSCTQNNQNNNNNYNFSNDLLTAKKEKSMNEEHEKNYVTPIIKKTLTIIHPKTGDLGEVTSVKRSLSNCLHDQQNFDQTTTKILQDRTNLNKNNSPLGFSCQSSFKKIKRFSPIEEDGQENIKSELTMKHCSSINSVNLNQQVYNKWPVCQQVNY